MKYVLKTCVFVNTALMVVSFSPAFKTSDRICQFVSSEENTGTWRAESVPTAIALLVPLVGGALQVVLSPLDESLWCLRVLEIFLPRLGIRRPSELPWWIALELQHYFVLIGNYLRPYKKAEVCRLSFLGYFPLKTYRQFTMRWKLWKEFLYLWLFPSSVVLIIMQKYMCGSKVISVECFFFFEICLLYLTVWQNLSVITFKEGAFVAFSL